MLACVLRVNGFLLLLVLGCMGLGFLDHAVNIFLAHAAVGLNGDLLLLARAQVFRGHVHDTVGINIEGDLDTGHSAGRRGDIGKLETAQGLVAGGHFPLALQHMDINRGLIVGSRGENLALMGRDGGIALNQLRAHTAQGLDAQGQRRDIQQQHILDLAYQHAALDGRAHGHALIRVHALGGLLVQDIADSILHSGDTGRTAHQDDLVDIAAGDISIGHGLMHRVHGALHQILGQLIELCPGESKVEMLRAGSVCRDEGQVDIGLGHAGKLDFRLLSRLHQTLGSHLVSGQVDAVLLLELLHHPVHDLMVEVIAAQVGIAVGGQHFKGAAGKLQDGDIEGAAAQVEDQNGFIIIFIQAVGKSCRRRLIDNAQNLQTGNASRILRSLALAVIEVSRHRDNCLGNRLPQISLCIRLQLLQNHSGDFLGRVILAVNGNLVVRLAHMTLDGSNGAIRVGHSLTLGQLAHQALAVLGETNHRRSNAATLGIRDNCRLAAFHNGDNRVSST